MLERSSNVASTLGISPRVWRRLPTFAFPACARRCTSDWPSAGASTAWQRSQVSRRHASRIGFGRSSACRRSATCSISASIARVTCSNPHPPRSWRSCGASATSMPATFPGTFGAVTAPARGSTGAITGTRVPFQPRTISAGVRAPPPDFPLERRFRGKLHATEVSTGRLSLVRHAVRRQPARDQRGLHSGARGRNRAIDGPLGPRQATLAAQAWPLAQNRPAFSAPGLPLYNSDSNGRISHVPAGSSLRARQSRFVDP